MEFIEADRLTPFETYMWADDTQEYPMVFFLRLRIHGELCRMDFEAAFADVVRRHPLLHATVAAPSTRRPSWRIHLDRYPSVLSHGLGERLTSGGLPHIDLTRQFGVRAWFATANNQTEVWLQFHHACCDGMAAVNFIKELFLRYQGGSAVGNSDEPASLQVTRILQRRNLPQAGGATRLPRPADLYRIWRFLKSRPERLPRCSDDTASDWRFPASLTEEIAECMSWQRVARSGLQLRSTVNDHLLSSVFAGMGDWARRQGSNPERNIRVAVPVNLRDPLPCDQTCANCVSMVFLDRQLQSMRSAAELLPGITSEMSQIKSKRLATGLLQALRAMSLWPGGMRNLLARVNHTTTTVLSNLGAVFCDYPCLDREQRVCVGEGVLESIDFLPPLRRGVTVAFGALTYANRLSCCMHYDPRLMTPRHAVQLFDGVMQQMPVRQCESKGLSCA